MDQLAVIEEGTYNEVSVEQRKASEKLKRQSRSKSTQRVYGKAWDAFTVWCERERFRALPADAGVVEAYLTHLSERALSASTIGTHLAAIAYVHREKGLSFDTARFDGTMGGIRRGNKRKPRKAKPATSDVLANLPTGSDLRSLRDRALILLGYWGCRRRSELAGLDASSELTAGATGFIERQDEGLVLNLLVSKSNQQGDSERYGIPYGLAPCPIAALDAWLSASGVTDGPLFRQINRWGKVGGRMTGHSINAIIKSHLGEECTGHALRRGFLVDGAKKGLTAVELVRQSGHKSLDMVREYTQEAELFRDNVAGKLAAKLKG